MNSVDPSPGQVGKSSDVIIRRQKFRLEAYHLARGRRLLGDGIPADDPSHGRITPKAVGIVHVFVTVEATEGRLAEQPGHPMLTVLAGSRVR